MPSNVKTDGVTEIWNYGSNMVKEGEQLPK
jgi:hypothetical protein